LNNVEGEEIRDLLPRTLNPDHRKPTVLITSRVSNWSHGVSVFALKLLNESEVIEIIRKHLNEAGVRDFTNIEQLVTEFGYLPLALQQATAYIVGVLKDIPQPATEYSSK
jgi:hypothetical protein